MVTFNWINICDKCKNFLKCDILGGFSNIMMSRCLKITEKRSHFRLPAKRATFTVLPDRSLLMEQKLVENAKIRKMRQFE